MDRDPQNARNLKNPNRTGDGPRPFLCVDQVKKKRYFVSAFTFPRQKRMIAVTIGTGPKYSLLARLSAATCIRHTGLPVHILGDDAQERHRVRRPHHLKFRLFQEFPEAENILYVDADTIFLRAFDVQALSDLPGLVCVRDVWERDWIREDAKLIGIPPKEYFNSGFFIVNRTHHQRMLETAENLLGRIVSRFNDQTVLNAARAQLGIPLHLLDKAYNHIAFEGCRDSHHVTIGHLSGIGDRPDEMIKQYFGYWERDRAATNPIIESLRAALVGPVFEYSRVGFDRRRMQFEADGSVGKGGGGYEERWEMTAEGEQITLWIVGRGQPTCALSLQPGTGTWRGRCIRHERMPVLLSPVDAVKI